LLGTARRCVCECSKRLLADGNAVHPLSSPISARRRSGGALPVLTGGRAERCRTEHAPVRRPFFSSIPRNLTKQRTEEHDSRLRGQLEGAMFQFGIVVIAASVALVLWKKWPRVRPEEARVRLLCDDSTILRPSSNPARSSPRSPSVRRRDRAEEWSIVN